MEFKYKSNSIVTHPINGEGIISDVRVNQQNKAAYWVEYKNCSRGHTEIEMDKHNVKCEINHNVINFKHQIGDLVKDIGLDVIGRIMCLNVNSSGDTMYSLQTKYGELWINENNLDKN